MKVNDAIIEAEVAGGRGVFEALIGDLLKAIQSLNSVGILSMFESGSMRTGYL
jgi:hypothetical protein